MKKMILGVGLSLCFVFIPWIVYASGYFRSLDIPQIPQETNYYCAVAVVQMWIDWLEGDAPSQDEIADDQGVTPNHGLTSNDIADALEDYSWDSFSDYSRSSKETFAAKMISEIKGGDPVAVSVNTRRRNGTITPCLHWLLVDSFWLSSSSYSTSWNNLKGFYMNDPLYNSAFTGTYYYISPSTYVAKNTFFDTIASKCTTQYYLVQD